MRRKDLPTAEFDSARRVVAAGRDAGLASDEFLLRFLPGSSTSVLRLRSQVGQLNATRNIGLVRSILIRGESGVGKNHLARVIAGHRRWRRLRNTTGDIGLEGGLSAFCDRFSDIHLPGLPDQLIESELFGHKKHAFTGADREKRGLLVGDVDDLLLDEIGDISIAFQTKLLGVIDHGRFRPLGADLDNEDEVDARLLMATNRPLEALVKNGSFREDLYQRIRLFVITVPPLREQPENIEQIARELEAEIQRGSSANIDPDSSGEIHLTDSDLQWARTYEWPGNARELRNAIIRWLLADGQRSLQDVVQELREAENLAQPHADVRGTIAGLVRARLNDARKAGTPAGRTLIDLVKEFEREVKTAVSEWYRASRPDDESLRRLFPGHRRSESIRNKLSQWRRA